MIVSPNLVKQNQNGDAGGFDTVGIRKENYVTPQGVKGETKVIYRVTAKQMQNGDISELRSVAAKVKSFIVDAFSRLKIPSAKKETLMRFLGARMQGNHSQSSTEFISANNFSEANKKLFHIPVEKQVRFVDGANTEIPRKPLAGK
jgi:hypothetical protein